MKENEVSAVMEHEITEKVVKMLDEIISLIPVLVSLSVKQRMKCHKMGDRSVAFVRNAYSEAKENPDLLPSFIDIAEMKKDIDYDTELAYIESKVKELADLLSDTRLKAGSEAMNAAVSIYNFIKQASNNNVAGARSAYETLKPRFEVTRQSKKEPKKEE